jgi:hypothetical protein
MKNTDYLELAEGVGTVLISVFFPGFTIPYALITYAIDAFKNGNTNALKKK